MPFGTGLQYSISRGWPVHGRHYTQRIVNLLMQGCARGAYLQLRAQLWVLICVNFQDSDSVTKVIIHLQLTLVAEAMYARHVQTQ